MKKVLLGLVIAFIINDTSINAKVYQSDLDRDVEGGGGYGFYWCEDWINSDPTLKIPDFYIIKYRDTGSGQYYNVFRVSNGVFSELKREDGFATRRAKVVDLDNDGECEILAIGITHGNSYGTLNGWSQITRIFKAEGDILIDKTHLMVDEIDKLYAEETDSMIEYLKRAIKSNKASGYINKSDGGGMSSIGAQFWYHILAINPNNYGIKLFKKYTLESSISFSYKLLKEMEDNLFEEGCWSKEFYNSHPLLTNN